MTWKGNIRFRLKSIKITNTWTLLNGQTLIFNFDPPYFSKYRYYLALLLKYCFFLRYSDGMISSPILFSTTSKTPDGFTSFFSPDWRRKRDAKSNKQYDSCFPRDLTLPYILFKRKQSRNTTSASISISRLRRQPIRESDDIVWSCW